MTATANNAHTRFSQWSDGCRYNPRSTVATGGELSFTAQFEPLTVDTIQYYTTDNSMNRAANIPEGLATDSVWGIKIDASAIKAGSTLDAIRLMGRKQANHTLTIYSGTNAPDEVLYEETFFDTLAYAYTFHTHRLSAPIALDGTKSLWIKLKCTEIDTPGVFSIWGGNPDGMLVGDDLHPRGDTKFSWMIQALFSNNLGISQQPIANSQQPIDIFPNPATNSVTISIDNSQFTIHNSQLSLLDLYGRAAYNNHVDRNEVTIDVSNLPKGIYLVKLETDGNSVVKKLIIK